LSVNSGQKVGCEAQPLTDKTISKIKTIKDIFFMFLKPQYRVPLSSSAV